MECVATESRRKGITQANTCYSTKFPSRQLYQENSDIAATIILGQKKLECTSLLIGQSTSCQALSDKEEYHPLLITQ
jgi:hypothetical protein